MKKRGIFKKTVLAVMGVILAAIAAFLILLLILSITEYKPEDIEAVEVEGNYSQTLAQGESIRVLTWNIGYGALGDNADFFMDGGSQVNTATAERVTDNMQSIAKSVQEISPDIAFFQEVDVDSKRSHYINEAQTLVDALPGYQQAFATNYKCLYVPYPLPTIGKVSGGIMTLSSFEVAGADRMQLPCPFSWPIRLANLKRCLLVERIPIENSEKELVIVNLHLEAYDDGEGKAMQTAILKEVLEKEAKAGNYVIAGGDFNQVFSEEDTSAYPITAEGLWEPGVINEDEFSNLLSFETDNSAPTCRSLDQPYENADKDHFQYYLIDGFIVSSNLQIDDVKTLDKNFEATDHNPVLLSVSLPIEE
ncbi:MAG: endonuclease [Agathobacter sp.]|nr:endonuclease [Agathobacter sp.]